MDNPLSIFRLVFMATIMTQSGCSDKVETQNAEIPVATVPAAEGRVVSVSDPFETLTQTASSGLRARWIAYGGTLTDVTLPGDRPVLVGFNTPTDYRDDHPYVGSIIGRVANRISEARFVIDETEYSVLSNEGAHVVHSGPEGFDRKIWDAEWQDEDIILRHTSPDGDQGYPGTLDVMVRTQLRDQELEVKLIAFTDVPTPVSLTHHGYWNPAGAGPVDRFILSSPADRFSVTDENNVATGETLSVDGTAYDFRTPRLIGPDLIDINLLVPGEGLREMATLTDGVNSITVLSDYPGLQIFTGDNLGEVDGLSPRIGLAMEPQYPPNAVNQPVDGEDTILRPGEVYRHTIIYRFDGPGFESSAP